jgi:hypothetical protein
LLMCNYHVQPEMAGRWYAQMDGSPGFQDSVHQKLAVLVK